MLLARFPFGEAPHQTNQARDTILSNELSQRRAPATG